MVADGTDRTDEKQEAARDSLPPLASQLLGLLANPEYYGKSNADLASVLKVSSRTIQKWKSDERLRKALFTLVGRRALSAAPQVMDALIKSALLEGKAGHSDRRLYFQLIGMVEDASKQTPAGQEKAEAQALGKTLEDRIAAVEQDLGRGAKVISGTAEQVNG